MTQVQKGIPIFLISRTVFIRTDLRVNSGAKFQPNAVFLMDNGSKRIISRQNALRRTDIGKQGPFMDFVNF